MIRRPPRSPPFPYPPLFRSVFLPPSFPVAAMAPRLSTTNTATTMMARRFISGRLRDEAPRHHRRRRVRRSEEHTSELQSLAYLVCRLLLEKKKQTST